MKFNLTLLMAAFLCCFGSLMAQDRNCATMEHLQMMQDQDPKAFFKMEEIERQTESYLESAERVDGTITIPVVVHVVYRTSTENISDAQIATQIQVLNDDFRRTNSDANGTWSQAADSEIEFCMASVDPNGNPTNGITRTQTSTSAHGTDDSVKRNSQGGKDAWPAGQYLNMWVCNIGGSILGYAQFPGGSATTDGVVMDYRYFGTNGTAQAPFNLGRTATHEVGHWLNLRHIWGDGNCNQDDFVADTPGSDAPNYGCATGHVSCSSTDMVENYMDYSDDACMNLFTQGQRARMRALFDNGGFRASLLNSTACGTPSNATCDDGIQNGQETGIDCGGPSCPPCPCTGNEVTVSITLDNYPGETAWTFTNASGAVVASSTSYASNSPNTNVSETVCLPDGCYDFRITDSYGDGICCQYGNGSYTVTDAGGTVLASGGQFTSSETTNVCPGGGPAPTCNDGILNGNETGVDCGGPDCAPCATCDDGVQNGNETGVDCGGPDCAPCATCNDGVQNGNETGVDCGGLDCVPCATCNDGVQNGNETGIDCGGPDCAPCNTGCNGTEVDLTIVLDNYPAETTWSLTDANGSTVATGGGYGNQSPGSSVGDDFCLGDGCYTFTINDSYGDGICCAYGNGSYTITDAGGSVLASGGQFGSTESVEFCLGDTGGGGGACSDVVVNETSFNSWGIWNDGGSDCRRSTNDAQFATTGDFCVRLRDNSGVASAMTTDNLDLSAFESLTVDFAFIANSMENGEDFFLRISTNDGSSYSTVAAYASGSDFVNNTFYTGSVTIDGPFSANTRLRFQCDASANADQVYIDDVTISGCTTGNFTAPNTTTKETVDNDEVETLEIPESKVMVFPNPARDFVNLSYELGQPAPATITISDISGREYTRTVRPMETGKQQVRLETDRFEPGVYLLTITTQHERLVRKFVVSQ